MGLSLFFITQAWDKKKIRLTKSKEPFSQAGFDTKKNKSEKISHANDMKSCSFSNSIFDNDRNFSDLFFLFVGLIMTESRF